MSKNNNTSTIGVSAAGLLGVALTVLKLTNLITWKWIWVLAPFWGGIAILLFILLIIIIISFIAAHLK